MLVIEEVLRMQICNSIAVFLIGKSSCRDRKVEVISCALRISDFPRKKHHLGYSYFHRRISTDQNTNLSFLQSVNDGSIEKEKCDDGKYIEEEKAGHGVASHYGHPNSKYYRLKYTNTILKTKNIDICVYNLGVGKVSGIMNNGLRYITRKNV